MNRKNNRVELDRGWWVSVSEKDARLAAACGGIAGREAELECAGDAANHPQKIDLTMGNCGWKFGFRPLQAEGAARHGGDAAFVGQTAGTEAKRLGAHFVTYAKVAEVPKAWKGKTVFLHLEKAYYHVTVWVNGTRVAHYIGGKEPHRVEVTGALAYGGKNEIVMTLGDVGVSGHREFDPFNYTGVRLPTCKEICDNQVHPVGYGGSDGRGAEEVFLEAVPPVRVEYVFANPKMAPGGVAPGVLKYLVVLRNDTAKPARVVVKSVARPSADNIASLIRQRKGKEQGKTLVERTAIVPAKGEARVAVNVAWEDAHLWDTDDPFLYDVVTTLSQGEHLIDKHQDAFGFREFTINGENFLLNGKVIHLMGQSGHVDIPQHEMSLEKKITFFRMAKDLGNINHVRLHARPHRRDWITAADRTGMLLTTETLLWTTGFHSFDWAGSEEACYENVRHHYLEALTRRDRNAPSVVIWSLSNEMSPITPWDLEDSPTATPPNFPAKMRAMTRIFKRLIAETEAEDDSRVTQMSSAVDFLGNLRMINMHYPKSFMAFPDSPHTSYWMDGPYKFRWYGTGYDKMPAWSWLKDKPLYFGEYICVYGATPDNPACAVGDKAFEYADGGSRQVQAKLWWREAQAYRRKGVSGFCAWAFLIGEETDFKKLMQKEEVRACCHAMRPLAVLNHSYQTRFLGKGEVAMSLSMHNDTRHDGEFECLCEAVYEGKDIATMAMPIRQMAPGDSVIFTHRFLLPDVQAPGKVAYHVRMRQRSAKGPMKVVDQWKLDLEVSPSVVTTTLPDGFGIFDPNGVFAPALALRGLAGATALDTLSAETVAPLKTLWIPFGADGAHAGDWRAAKRVLRDFVERGGNLVMDHAPMAVLSELPIPVANGQGYAGPAGDTLEITYAYPCAPHHPMLKGFAESDFSLWGRDHYVARRCMDIPQEGNVVPLLLAGVDAKGLVSSPLMELRLGKGCFLLSMLEILPKLGEDPVPGRLLGAMAQYRAQWALRPAAIVADDATWQRIREVGYEGANAMDEAAAVIVACGDSAKAFTPDKVRAALAHGKTVYLQGLGVADTQAMLAALSLPGTVLSGNAEKWEWDVFRHRHPLTTGMNNNYLYWMIEKAKLAPWTSAPTHPEPSTARIQLPDADTAAAASEDARPPVAASLTPRGALTVYALG
ncbi:MAG: hypothetical protein FWF84_05700, partial [Kiritimatiellaeota bacterium]|nr:hypothetical protein [Kiritimatiellota bacterium]